VGKKVLNLVRISQTFPELSENKEGVSLIIEINSLLNIIPFEIILKVNKISIKKGCAKSRQV
jgi:hypothetical protein